MAQARTRGRKPGTKMTNEHKAALAAGRDEARAVKAYLEGLESIAPKKRGRRRTPETIRTRLNAIEKSLADASALGRLQLLQEKLNLEEELASHSATDTTDLAAARSGFVKVAKAYSARKGISYRAWRAAGVDAATLKAAGVARSS